MKVTNQRGLRIQDLFPLTGIQYWRAPTPTSDQWRRDLGQIARLGFDAVQLRVQWSWQERHEGQLDFSEVTRLMDLAHEAGLGVVVKFMLEDAPYWLFDNYAADRVEPSGQVIAPAARGAFFAGLSMPCFDRPIVRHMAEPFIRGLTCATGNHPALLCYSLWNEIRSRPYGQCACPDSRRKFEAWLKAQFGSVGAMNRKLGKDFGKFSHFRPPASLTDHTSPLIWRTWCRDTLADTLTWVRDTVRQVKSDAIVVVHSGMCNAINNALGDATNDRMNAEVVDMLGHSGVFWDGTFTSYQEIAGKATRANPHWRRHQYVLSMQDNWVRGVADRRPTMNYEVYANDYGAFNPDFGPAEMNDFFLTSLAEGMNVLMMWQYRSERLGQEANASGLVSVDGKATPRARQVGRILRFVREHRDLLRNYWPERGRVAIIYDQASDLLGTLQDHAESGHTSSDQYCYKNNLKGWYRLLWDANIPTDLLSSEQTRSLARYQAVVLPNMMQVPTPFARRIADYVAGGGRLLVDCGFDARLPNGWARTSSPGPWFGRIARVHMDKHLLTRGGEVDSVFGHLPLGAYCCMLSRANGPWGSFENEQVTYLPFHVGEARFLHPEADFAPFYAWLQQRLGLRRQHGELRIRKGRSGRMRVWFVHNLSDHPAEFPLANAKDIFTGATTIAPDTWAVLVAPPTAKLRTASEVSAHAGK